MRLSEILKQYRIEHKLSQRRFAEMCGDVTNGYVSMVENEFNPSTGKKVIPSIEKLSSFARGMGISLKELMEKADDINIQDANDTMSIGERILNYITLFNDSAKDVASILGVSVDELNRIIASDIDLTYQQAQILANRYKVDVAIFCANLDDEEAEPAHRSGPLTKRFIRLFETLSLDEQQRLYDLVQVMSEAHRASQAPEDQA